MNADKQRIAMGLMLLLVALIAGCGPATPTPTPQPSAVIVTDNEGRAVEIAEAPERIVSLAPSNTEIIFALGLGDKVVGVTDFCDYPEEAKAIEKVGGIDPNAEKILSLSPDLILAIGGSPAQVEKATALESLGLTVLILNPGGPESILANVELVGQATGAEKAASDLTASLRARLEIVEEKVASTTARPRVFYELDATDPSKPYTPGPGSFIDGLIGMAGGTNVAAGARMQWAQLSAEEIIVQDPEVIVLGDANYGVTVESVLARPGWGVITAVKNGAVYPIDDVLVSRPGPRFVDGLEELARLIHPDLFE